MASPFDGELRKSRPLRRRITSSILGITGLAVLLFALPLAVAVHQLYREEQLARLERDATRIVALIPDNPVSATRPVAVPSTPGSAVIGIYTPSGELVGGHGPERSPTAARSADGHVHEDERAGDLEVTVPVPSDRQIVAVVRAAVPSTVVSSRAAGSWVAMALLGLVVLAMAAALTRRQARRVAAPLERLTVAARALGDGDFSITAEHSGIEEADQASTALADTAARLGRLLERERAFSADASHQLRTPLTGLLLGLESALQRPAADLRSSTRDALDRGRQLETTIDDLLRLGRDTSTVPGTIDLRKELEGVARRWRPELAAVGRRLTLTASADLPPARASAAALRQILDVLMDNALGHGAGTVSIHAIDMDDAVAVDVGDQGSGLSGDPEVLFVRRPRTSGQHGIGLPLARSLAEADGGRLVVRRADPGTVLRVLLPVADSAAPRTSDHERHGSDSYR